MAYENIDSRISGALHLVTLDRPGKPNPIDDRTIAELNAVLDEFEADEETRVLVVTGTENAFATGADISYLEDWISAGNWDEMLRFVREGQRLTNRIERLDAPTIAAINGYALGGGLELALAFDFRFAAESATLGLPEIDLGLLPGWGGTQRLPRVVGHSTAKDMLLTGKHLDADRAAEIDLVDRVFADGKLLTEASAYAEELAAKPPETMQYLLEAVRVGGENPLDGGLTYELMNNMLSAFTDEARRRTQSFAEE